MGKVIVRIRGGLGNQLFCYAAARCLSLMNGAELVIDDVTGFRRDRKYKRTHQKEVSDRMQVDAEIGIMEYKRDDGGNLKAGFVLPQPRCRDILALAGNNIAQTRNGQLPPDDDAYNPGRNPVMGGQHDKGG